MRSRRRSALRRTARSALSGSLARQTRRASPRIHHGYARITSQPASRCTSASTSPPKRFPRSPWWCSPRTITCARISLRRLDDRPARVSGCPGRGSPRSPAEASRLFRLCQLCDDVRRRGQRLAFVRRDVIQRPEVARHVEVERHIRHTQDGDAAARLVRLRNRALERPLAAVRAVVADENPAHASQSLTGAADANVGG